MYETIESENFFLHISTPKQDSFVVVDVVVLVVDVILFWNRTSHMFIRRFDQQIFVAHRNRYLLPRCTSATLTCFECYNIFRIHSTCHKHFSSTLKTQNKLCRKFEGVEKRESVKMKWMYWRNNNRIIIKCCDFFNCWEKKSNFACTSWERP